MDPERLLKMSGAELDALFRASPVGKMPDGDSLGVALLATNTVCAGAIAGFIRRLVWQGKIFHAKDGWLINKLTPFGIKTVRGKLYFGPSWMDGRDCIVLDYSTTSLVACWIRDEIRQIESQYFLGRVYLWRMPLFHFSLKFHSV